MANYWLIRDKGGEIPQIITAIANRLIDQPDRWLIQYRAAVQGYGDVVEVSTEEQDGTTTSIQSYVQGQMGRHLTLKEMEVWDEEIYGPEEL